VKAACDWQAITGPHPTGLGVAVRCLMQALEEHAPDWELLGLRPNLLDAALRGVPDRLAWEQARLPLALVQAKRAGAQLVFSPALGAPLFSPLPRVAYVHDLIPLKQPGHFTGAARWYWSTLLPATWRRCQALAVSNHTIADELAALLGYPRARIHLAPYYIDPLLKSIADELHAGEPTPAQSESCAVFITVGSHEPRKNLELAIRALALYNQARVPARLVITGTENAYTLSLRRLADECGVINSVQFTGYLDRRQLVSHLLSATALLFVSREEGFGLPPLEAQSLGCPAILSDLPVLRAAHADPARLAQLPQEISCSPPFIPEDDPAALAEEMARLTSDAAYRAGLVRFGLAYAATFTPQTTARGLTAAFMSVL
jgi:glycosyltransferase involved in cell wall biosynthesis